MISSILINKKNIRRRMRVLVDRLMREKAKKKE